MLSEQRQEQQQPEQKQLQRQEQQPVQMQQLQQPVQALQQALQQQGPEQALQQVFRRKRSKQEPTGQQQEQRVSFQFPWKFKLINTKQLPDF